MSESDTASGDMGTEQFQQLQPEAAEEAASMFERVKQLTSAADDMGSVGKYAKRLIKPAGEGRPVEEITEEYGCSEPIAYTVRGLMRATGVEDYPPVADMAVGIYKAVR